VDRDLIVAVIQDAAGWAIGTLVHYSCHPVAAGAENRLATADWCGVSRSLLEAAGSGPVLLINGAAGDVNPRMAGRGFPAVEAAGAYGTACRRSDRLEVEIRRLEAKAALVPAALGFQADLVRLRMAHAQICLEAQGALQAWQCHLATPRPMPAGAARSPEGALAEATWPNSPLAVPAIPREGAGALSAHSAAPRQVF